MKLPLPVGVLAAGALTLSGGYYTWQVLAGTPITLRFWQTPPPVPTPAIEPIEYREAPIGVYDRMIILVGFVGGGVFLWWKFGPRRKPLPKPPSPPPSPSTHSDYYTTLGLTKGCSADDIKKAYRKLALLHHPDKNLADRTAEARFKTLTEAYRVLSNPEKRSLYDDCILWKRVNLPDGEG